MKRVTDRAAWAWAVISSCTPRFANVEVSTNTFASRITRPRPGNLGFSDRARDPKLKWKSIDRLKDLVVTNDTSPTIPSGASDSMQSFIVKDLPAITGGTLVPVLAGTESETLMVSLDGFTDGSLMVPRASTSRD
jgi:hypothetical protein